MLAGLCQPSIAATETPREQTRGAVGGLVVGGLAAGPIGAVAGSIVGAEVIGRLFSQNREGRELGVEIAGLRASLERTKEEKFQTEQQISRLNKDIDKLVKLQQSVAKTQSFPVQFRTGSADIEAQYETELENIARVLRRNRDASVNLTGYADRRGDETYNQDLSEDRIKAIESFLVSNGVTGSQILGIAYGESQPLAIEETLENNFFDRRVLVELSMDIDPQLATR